MSRNLPAVVPVQLPVEPLPIGKLFVDFIYQRKPDVARILDIANNFDIHAFQVLEVSARPRGRFAVFDGGHRLGVGKLLHMPTLWCRIHSGLTIEDEAALFNILQSERRKLSQVQLFKADIVRKYEPAIRVRDVAEANGYHVGKNIQSVAGLYFADRHGVLNEVLSAAQQAWGPVGLNRQHLSGLTIFFSSFEGEAPIPALVTLALGYTPAHLTRGANKYVADGIAWHHAIARVVMDRYNEAAADNPQQRLAQRDALLARLQ